ncbi:MAG: putative bifunctional diguanylate cyclase/phosphodiesterase [Acidimicrobiia bacterium]
MTAVVGVGRVCVLLLMGTLAFRSFRWSRRGGGQTARWLTASFAVLAAVILAGVVSPRLAAHQGSALWKLAVCGLLLFPYCLGRFTAGFGGAAASRRRHAISAGVTLGLVLATLALPTLSGAPRRPAPYQAFAVAFMAGWTLQSVLSARSLWQAGRDRPTVVRRRMRTLSLGSSMVNVALLLLGTAPPARPPVQLVVLSVGMVSAWLFFVGFAPPAALRALWRQPDLDLFHAAEGRLVAATEAETVGRVIVPQAVTLLGAGASLMTGPEGRVRAADGLGPAEVDSLVAELDRWGGSGASGVEELVPGILSVRLRDGWLVATASPVTPFFGRQEHRLFEVLGRSADLALERVELHERDRISRIALEERERQLAQGQRLAHFGSWELDLATGRVLMSEELVRIYQLDPAALDDADHGWFQERSHPDDRQAMEKAVRRAIASGRPFQIDHRLVMPDGQVRWLHSRGRTVSDDDGNPVRLQGTAQDITAGKEAESQLRASALQQAAVAQLGQRALGGLATEALLQEAADLVSLVLGVDRAGVLELLHEFGNRTLVVNPGESAPAGFLDVEALAPHGLGATDMAFLTSVSNVLAAAIQRHEAETELAHQALHDPLTGLPNRALLMDRLDQAAARARRQPVPLTVLFLDLDRFKFVNDGLGHGAGDELLRVVARRLSETLRPGDTVARFGGDEFVVLCENLPGEDAAAALADRVAAALSRPVAIAGREVSVTASIGIVVADAALVSPEELLRDADIAMYQAKERGRARHEVFDAPARKRVMDRLNTEVALHRAVERAEFRLWYQPEVALDDGRIVGLEALLRWEHPEWGLQHPGQFLQMAEETGLILPIGEWALEEACRQTQALRAAGPALASAVLWVNLSARQLTQPDLHDVVARVLAETGTDPGRLGLEITETVLMEDVESLSHTLRGLRELGVLLAIDDFGTGFSSLSWLRQFPVDVLKVDRSFVDGVTGRNGDRAIVEAVIGLARSMEMLSVAEGVESRAQAAALRSLGCDAAQGYYFCRPMSLADLLATLASNGGRLPVGHSISGSPFPEIQLPA